MQANDTFLGIEIGGTKLQLVVADASGGILQTIRHTVDPSGGAEAICSQIKKEWDKLPSRDEIKAIGVGFGGPIDQRTGIVCTSHQVPGWDNFSIKQWLHTLTGKPVAVDNDANVGALAEAIKGSGKGYERVFYMTVGSGIGGGLVIRGMIYHGSEPGEAEVGHLRLNKDGETLESACSGWAVNRKVKTYILDNPDSLLARLSLHHPGPEAMLLAPALESKDSAAQSIVEEVADNLSFGLSHVVHLFHPDIIILGGGLSLLRDHLLQPLTQRLPHYIMNAFLPPPQVLTAALGENVVPLGAVELAKSTVAMERHCSPIQNSL